MGTIEALLLGRKTYEGFASAWPAEEGTLADKSPPAMVATLQRRDADDDPLSLLYKTERFARS